MSFSKLMTSKVAATITENQAATQLVDFMLDKAKHSCQCYHIGTTCNARLLEKFRIIFLALLKINLPIHIIPLILFKLKTLKQKPVQTLGKLAVNIVRSVMFLTSFVVSIFVIQCYGSRLLPSLPIKYIHVLSSMLSGLGIAFEQPHKRVEIIYYVLPRNLEGIQNFLAKRKLDSYFKYQEVLLFAIAMGMLGMCFNEGKNSFTLRGFTAKICKYLWTETKQQEIQAKVEQKE